MPEAPGYVLAHCLFSERVSLGQARPADVVLF